MSPSPENCGPLHSPCVGLTQADEGVFVDIHVQPNAKRDSIVGPYNGRIKIALAAPPVDGKANDKLIAFLSKSVRLPKSRLQLVRGTTSRDKRVLISGAKLSDLPALMLIGS